MTLSSDLDRDGERALIERCRGGDQAAFTELVDRYKDLVFGLVLRSVADRGRAEDLAQDVFLRIHRGLPYFRGDARLSTWIYRIVLNLCAEERAPRAHALSLDTDEIPAMALRSAGSERVFSDLEARDAVEKALEQLPPRARFLIAAHYLKGMRYEDLADAFKVPMGTLKTHLHRAKKRLRRIIEESQGSGS
jgi:RNA polymerase sigma-70 factor (ECF subfamily)